MALVAVTAQLKAKLLAKGIPSMNAATDRRRTGRQHKADEFLPPVHGSRRSRAGRADVWESNDRGTGIGASHVGRPEPFSSIGSTLCRVDRRVGPEAIRISDRSPRGGSAHLLRFHVWAPSGVGDGAVWAHGCGPVFDRRARTTPPPSAAHRE